MARGFVDGARLMRASFELVRRDLALLWFPVISACCLVLIAAFWIFEGAWLYAVNSAWFFYVPLVAIGLYSLFFVGIFFNVALKALLRFILLCGFVLTAAAGVVRQVFAVELYRVSTG